MISKNSGSKMYEGNITSIVKYFYYSKITTTPTPNHTYMGDFTHQMIKLPGVSILLNFPEFFFAQKTAFKATSEASFYTQARRPSCRPSNRRQMSKHCNKNPLRLQKES